MTFRPYTAPALSSGFRPFDDSQASLALSQRMADAVEAQKKAVAASSPVGLATETAKGTIGGLFDPLVKGARSGVQAIGELFGAKPNYDQTYTGFAGTPQQTLQSDVYQGKTTPLAGTGEFALDAASAMPIGKAGALGKQGIEAVAPKVAEAGGAVSKMFKPITNLVTDYFAKRSEKKAIDTAIKSVTPRTGDLSVDEFENLLRQKRVTPKTRTSPSKYILSEREKGAAIKNKDILQEKDPVKNSIKIMDKIATEDKAVGDFLDKNNGIFNSGELKNYIAKDMEDISDVTIPEERIAKLKEQISENFLSGLKKNDMKSLWEARKEFDQQIENAFSGSPTLQKQVKKRFRNSIQEYIAEHTPDDVYKTKMKDMTDLFNLEDIVGTRAAKEKGKNAIQIWIKENPTKAKILGWGSGAIGAGAVWDATH